MRFSSLLFSRTWLRTCLDGLFSHLWFEYLPSMLGIVASGYWVESMGYHIRLYDQRMGYLSDGVECKFLFLQSSSWIITWAWYLLKNYYMSKERTTPRLQSYFKFWTCWKAWTCSFGWMEAGEWMSCTDSKPACIEILTLILMPIIQTNSLILQERGYQIETNWLPTRVELYSKELGYIDIHPFVLNADGTSKQADLDGGWYEFQPDYFGTAVFEGRSIPCISAKGNKYSIRATI